MRGFTGVSFFLVRGTVRKCRVFSLDGCVSCGFGGGKFRVTGEKTIVYAFVFATCI